MICLRDSEVGDDVLSNSTTSNANVYEIVSTSITTQLVGTSTASNSVITFTTADGVVASTTMALNAALLRGILAGAPYGWLGLPRAAAAVALPELDLLLLALLQEGCAPAVLGKGLVRAMARLQKQFADGVQAAAIVQPFLQMRLPGYARAGLSAGKG